MQLLHAVENSEESLDEILAPYLLQPILDNRAISMFPLGLWNFPQPLIQPGVSGFALQVFVVVV